MARINIEDSLFKDIRFMDLVAKFGCLNTAIGALVRAWALAQKHYLNYENDQLIPSADWKKQRIRDELIEVGLAELRPKGYYVSGSKEQFAWLEQKITAGRKGGLASAKKRKENKALKAKPSAAKQGQAKASKPKHSQPSYSSSSSLSSSSSNSSSSTQGGLAAAPREPGASAKCGPTWKEYADAYETKYQQRPIWNATVAGQLSAFIKRVGASSAPGLARWYVNHPKSFYRQNQHPVKYLLADAEGLHTQWRNQRPVTNAQAQVEERLSENKQVVMDYIEETGGGGAKT